jgi:hypothetical protein
VAAAAIFKPVQLARSPEVGVPNTGVTSVGEVANTNDPVPVSSVTAVARLAELGVPRKVDTPAPKPVIPPNGRPVQFVSVPEDGVPNTGVTSVGEVANTNDPEPVSSVTAVARLAELGVPRKLDTPAPKPVIPPNGKPVQLVSVPEDGVPNTGVTSVGVFSVGVFSVGVASVGEVPNTNDPVPVSSVTAAARLAELGVPRKVATPVPNEVIPVPPEATGKAEARVSEVRWVTTSTTFVPLL